MLRFRFFDHLGVVVREELARESGVAAAQERARQTLDACGYSRAEIVRDARLIARLARELAPAEEL